MDDNPIILIDKITELNDLHEFLQSEHLDKVLELVLKLLVKPSVPQSKVPELIVQLQAYSAVFAIQSIVYATLNKGPAGSDSNYKKNIYYTLRDAVDKLVDALKYSARYGV